MLKQDLASAQARIAELEEAARTSAETIATQNTKISELDGKIAELENSAKSHSSEIEAKDKANSELSDKVTALETEKTNLTGEIATLKESAKNVETASDEKAREIAARNGADLPEKAAEAGNKTTDNAEAATGTPRERLAALWEPKAYRARTL